VQAAIDQRVVKANPGNAEQQHRFPCSDQRRPVTLEVASGKREQHRERDNPAQQ